MGRNAGSLKACLRWPGAAADGRVNSGISDLLVTWHVASLSRGRQLGCRKTITTILVFYFHVFRLAFKGWRESPTAFKFGYGQTRVNAKNLSVNSELEIGATLSKESKS